MLQVLSAGLGRLKGVDIVHIHNNESSQLSATDRMMGIEASAGFAMLVDGG